MHANESCFKCYFVNRTANAWNSKPEFLFNTNLVLVFKHRILKIDWPHFVSNQTKRKCSLPGCFTLLIFSNFVNMIKSTKTSYSGFKTKL